MTDSPEKQQAQINQQTIPSAHGRLFFFIGVKSSFLAARKSPECRLRGVPRLLHILHGHQPGGGLGRLALLRAELRLDALQLRVQRGFLKTRGLAPESSSHIPTERGLAREGECEAGAEKPTD